MADADFAFLGENPEDLLHKATVAGDVDGDGLDDVLLASSDSDIGTQDAGAVYLVSGANITSGSFVVSDTDAIYVGSNFDEQAGYSIAGGGDHDGDGFDDLLVGAIGGAQNGTIREPFMLSLMPQCKPVQFLCSPLLFNSSEKKKETWLVFQLLQWVISMVMECLKCL